jgi:2',3'-cyclic-nucleotide 2'-phosphodiesterase/3'-nucleotidase
VKVAIIGITTPHIPTWDPPEHYKGYRFEDGVQAAAEAVAEVKRTEHPDLILVAAHAGLGRGSDVEHRSSSAMPPENMIDSVAEQVSGLDGIIFGHTHQSLPGRLINGVLLMQPKNWGMSLGRMDFVLTRESGGPWKVVSKESALIPVTADTAPDPGILRIGRPYHELAERYLNTRITGAPAALDARYSRVEDTALVDAIQEVQLAATQADVSFASAFNPNVEVPAGPVTVREIAALYPYENELYVLSGNGRMVREALENAAHYFLTCQAGCAGEHLINPRVIGYNFDMAEGISYEIDLTQPEGHRIVNLRRHGKLLADDQPVRIAVNNFRAGGSGGYAMFPGAPVVWRSHEEIRDMMVRYYSAGHTLPAVPENNWRVEPAAARAALENEAVADAARQRNLNR